MFLSRSMIKTLCILMPILGLTWVFGIVTFNKNTLAFQYIFAVLNSLQVGDIYNYLTLSCVNFFSLLFFLFSLFSVLIFNLLNCCNSLLYDDHIH